MEIQYVIINFLILAAILVIAGRKTVKRIFGGRLERVNRELDEARFFGMLSLNSRMAHSALSRSRCAAESAVGTYEMAVHAGHALFLYMLDMAECNGLLLGNLHKVRQDPPAKNKGHDQPHDKRAPATAAFFRRSRCGCVFPLLHPDASCWLR